LHPDYKTHILDVPAYVALSNFVSQSQTWSKTGVKMHTRFF